MQLYIALSILAVTIALAVSHLKIWKLTIDHAVASIIGALLMATFQIVPFRNWPSAIQLLYIPMITVTSLMTITFVADYSGLFQSLIQFLVEKAKGDGRKLYAFLFFTGSILGTIFSNDAVVLLFTPLVLNLVENIKRPTWELKHKIPFYFSVLSMANLVGGLTISNPINVVVASRFNIGFMEYARWMLIPSTVGMISTYFALIYFFGKTIPAEYTIPAPPIVSPEQKLFQKCVAVTLVITSVSMFLTREPASHFVLPISALINIILYKTFSSEKFTYLVKEIGWDLIVFMFGMFIVAMGLKDSGLALIFKTFFDRIYQNHFSILSIIVGQVSAASSALINNHATVDFMTWVLKDLNLDLQEIKMLAYSIIVGGDVGPKMFPLGSLAAIMWFRMLKKRGVQISFKQYIQLGIPISVFAIILALIALNIEYSLSFL